VVTKKKRPKIPKKKNDKITIFLFNIVEECWKHETFNRPTINDIFISLDLNLNKLEYNIYF
jgi:hypothetical protein